MNNKKSILNIQGTTVTILSQKEHDYISLTDIAKYRNLEEPFSVINNWSH